MYGIQPRYNEPRSNEFFHITNTIRKPKRKIFLDVTNSTHYSRQTLNRSTVSKSFNPHGKDQETETFQSTAYYMSQTLALQYFQYRSHLCYKSIINYDLDITNFLVVSPQIRYIAVSRITNPPFNVQIWPVPSDFVKSRFHCNQ